jgi:hypothetical protein
MKAIGATIGAFALNLALIVLGVLVLAFALWVLLPAAIPGLAFTYSQGLSVAALLFLARGVFK